MPRARIALLIGVAVLLFTTSLQAQTGCGDSPENPTAVFGLIGAGGWLATAFRGRICRFLGKVWRGD